MDSSNRGSLRRAVVAIDRLEPRALLSAESAAVPDLLTVIETGPPASVLTGSTGRIAVRVGNFGDADLKGAMVSVGLYASTDGRIDSGDVKLASVSKRMSLRGGGSFKTVPMSFEYSGALPDGDYRLLARADDTFTLREADELNNDSAAPGSVRVAKPFVDLGPAPGTFGEADLSSFRPGRRSSVAIKVFNAGNVPFKGVLDVALTAAPTFGFGDTPIDGGMLSRKASINPGTARTLRFNFVVTTALSFANSLQFTLDPQNHTADPNPADNTFSVPFWSLDTAKGLTATNTYSGGGGGNDGLIVKFTWIGDLNLDGFVDFQDLSVFNPNSGNNASTGNYWFEGDFNYDGVIDSQD